MIALILAAVLPVLCFRLALRVSYPPTSSDTFTAPPTSLPPPLVDPDYFPLLDLRGPFTHAEVIAAYRSQAMKLHPDQGGWADLFRELVHERDAALKVATAQGGGSACHRA